MIEQFVSMMLGPSGTKLLAWYVENSLVVNGVLVGMALIFILAPRKTRWIRERLQQAWDNSPLALNEKDRQAVEKAKQRYQSNKKNRKR